MTKKTKLKKAYVKKILMDPVRVSVLGPKSKKNNYYLEKELTLHNTLVFKETEKECFQFLRKLLVGK